MGALPKHGMDIMSFFERKITSPSDALDAIYDELDYNGTLDEHVVRHLEC